MSRPSRATKREEHDQRLAGKRDARAELEAERKAAHWTDPGENESEPGAGS